MATSTKRASRSKAKQSAKAPAKRSKPSSKPYVRFYHSEALRAKTLSVLTTIEQAPDAAKHRDDLTGIVVELMNSGMDYYFMKSLKKAKAGFVVVQSANLGLASVQQVMGSVIRQVIGRMDNAQLVSVCGSIRELML